MPASNANRALSAPTLSRDDYRLLVDSIADYAIFMLDVDGRVATWNRGADKIKGYSADEIIGRHFSVFYAAEDIASGRPERVLERARAAGRAEDEGLRARKDGSLFWANVVITALRDENGALRGFGKVTRDLTARRAAEENERELLREKTARAAAEAAERERRQSEERYRALSRRLEIVLEGVADGITVQDRTGRVIFANSAAARLCGFASVDEFLNTPPQEIVARFELLNEWDQPFDPENLPGRRVLMGAPSHSALLHVRERKTGQDFWSLVRAGAVNGSDGRPELAVNIWHDVSAEHHEERQAKLLADATVALGRSLDHEVMLTNLAGVLVPALADLCAIYLLEGNELRNVVTVESDPEHAATEQLRRYSPSPTSDRGAWSVVKSGKAELHESLADETLAQAATDDEQLERLRAIAPKAAVLAPVRSPSKVLGVIALVSTASNRKYDQSHLALAVELGQRAGAAVENARLYRAAQESARAAEAASRAKDEFLATVSHELRTPLNAIVGWATLLRTRVTDPALVKPIEVIDRNAQAQVKIIDDILDVSRVVTGKFRIDAKPADLVVVARDAIEVVRPSAYAKSIDLEFAPEREFCLLVADPERLQQVVWNLLSNAVKFTSAGGKVRLSIQQVGSSVTLTVADTGAGIDPEFLPFVFDRFTQADPTITRRVGGLGLGLALVRHIVELHGGSASAASEGVGKGASFTITLPIRAVAPQAEVPPSPSVPRVAPGATALLHGIKVLLVDDEPDARDLVAVVLTGVGATVETAGSAAEGLALLRSFRPDVLVSDIGMPDEDGFSFMRRVRSLPEAEGGRVPAIALTAYTRDEDRAAATAVGYHTHVGKPVNPHELATTVATVSGRARA
jgi:PAS domain S-box-containing protein